MRCAQAQSQVMEDANPSTAQALPEPTYCPFCGGRRVIFTNTWRAQSEDPADAGNAAELDEHQCLDCNNRSFWS